MVWNRYFPWWIRSGRGAIFTATKASGQAYRLNMTSQTQNQAFQTQKVVEQEARSLQAQAAKFSKQTQQWMGCIGAFDQALKELGDFENYVRTLEWEIQTVSDALERAATAGPPEGENQ